MAGRGGGEIRGEELFILGTSLPPPLLCFRSRSLRGLRDLGELEGDAMVISCLHEQGKGVRCPVCLVSFDKLLCKEGRREQNIDRQTAPTLEAVGQVLTPRRVEVQLPPHTQDFVESGDRDPQKIRSLSLCLASVPHHLKQTTVVFPHEVFNRWDHNKVFHIFSFEGRFDQPESTIA